MVAFSVAATAEVIVENTSLDSILGQFLDLGLVGAIAVMFYTFWRMANARIGQVQEERIEELLRQRDAAVEERDLWYAENMKQYQERIRIYQEFIAARGVVSSADEIIQAGHPPPVQEGFDLPPPGVTEYP